METVMHILNWRCRILEVILSHCCLIWICFLLIKHLLTMKIPLRDCFDSTEHWFFDEWSFAHVAFWAFSPCQEINEYLRNIKVDNTMQYNDFILIRTSDRLKIQNLVKCFGDGKSPSCLKLGLWQMLVVIEIDYWSHDMRDKFSPAHVHIFIIDLLYWFFSKKQTSSDFDLCSNLYSLGANHLFIAVQK